MADEKAAMESNVSGVIPIFLPTFGSSKNVTVSAGDTLLFRAVDQENTPAGVISMLLTDPNTQLGYYVEKSRAIDQTELYAGRAANLYFCSLSITVSLSSTLDIYSLNLSHSNVPMQLTMEAPERTADCNYGEKIRADRTIGIACGSVGAFLIVVGVVLFLVGLRKDHLMRQSATIQVAKFVKV
ncbi:hypothetical protein PROFUN_05493 [Planoprotostelium fungivorum]|uniref:Uncharacterized protein n=1 Tax=Planoprotostelium fungivorum TaxID=1890364 RepID=A0A2P6NQV9_9EUKA|nr:hypothetical protein PROFUN_05493 [Planoprotostelium fungivorum]